MDNNNNTPPKTPIPHKPHGPKSGGGEMGGEQALKMRQPHVLLPHQSGPPSEISALGTWSYTAWHRDTLTLRTMGGSVGGLTYPPSPASCAWSFNMRVNC